MQAGPDWKTESMRGRYRILLLVVGVTVILALAFQLGRRGKSPVRLPAESCDADLWSHVYQPERLQVIVPCTVVQGRVTELRRQSDGDIHIRLDVEDTAVLNIYNRLHAHGDLIVELICEVPTERAAPIAACAGFTPQITIPGNGDRVRVTGALVKDRDNGWNEIHPVTKIEVLR